MKDLMNRGRLERWSRWWLMVAMGEALSGKIWAAIALSFAGIALTPTLAQATMALDFSLRTEVSLAPKTKAVAPQPTAQPSPETLQLEAIPPETAPQLIASSHHLGALVFVPPEPSQSKLTTAKSSAWTQPFALLKRRSPFDGGTQSLVARVVGHAEGTRTLTGETTWAYWGHVDPGNQVWNRGTFSYQHAAASPEDADAKQLKRLQRQTQELERQAKAKGIKLSLLEMLNGIDLANQAPLAALDRGYIDWLAEAKQMDWSSEDAILWARTWSYWDPDLKAWNAPGLGNTRSSIEADQQRRQWAIAQVLKHCSQDTTNRCSAP